MRAALLLLAAVAFGFVAGVVAHRQELLPSALIRRVLSPFWPKPALAGNSARMLETSLLPVEARVYPYGLLPPDETRGGGGIAAAGNSVIGATKQGEFFLFSTDATFRRLELPRLELNIEALRTMRLEMDALRREGIDADDLLRRGLDPNNPGAWNLRSLRVLDIALRDRAARTHIYVSYTYWHPDRQCKATRLAQLVVDSLPVALEPQTSRLAWQVVFESKPCLPFSYRANSPFQSPNTAGRLAFIDDDRLLMSVGDHHIDNYNNPTDPSYDYGKILEFDLNTFEARTYATGVRNAQGLFVDADGNVWETEHGPQGGDELNRVRRGTDYGWPRVTYGVQYDSMEWKQNPAQGRHDGFAAPLFAWLPSVAISNLIRVRAFSDRWNGDLLVTSLRAGNLYRIRVDTARAYFAEPIPLGERVRDIDELDNGTIVLWTDSRRIITLHEKLHERAAAAAGTQGRGLDNIIASCAQCHSLSRNTSKPAAPPLWGIFGRNIASTGFESYSAALKNVPGNWNERSLTAFLRNPDGFAPGTTMPPPGLQNDALLDSLVAHLRRLR